MKASIPGAGHHHVELPWATRFHRPELIRAAFHSAGAATPGWTIDWVEVTAVREDQTDEIEERGAELVDV